MVRPEVLHEVVYPIAGSLTVERMEPWIEHRYQVIVPPLAVGCEKASQQAVDVPPWPERLASGRIALSETRFKEFEATGAYELARLDVIEIPWRQAALEGGWHQALDQAGQFDTFFRIVEALEHGFPDDTSEAFYNGRLFIASELHVHPAARGERLGLRLLRRAMLELLQSDSDAMLLVAADEASRYEPVPENYYSNELNPRDPKVTRALARYYSRIGFRTLGEPAEDELVIPMFALIDDVIE